MNILSLLITHLKKENNNFKKIKKHIRQDQI